MRIQYAAAAALFMDIQKFNHGYPKFDFWISKTGFGYPKSFCDITVYFWIYKTELWIIYVIIATNIDIVIVRVVSELPTLNSVINTPCLKTSQY